MNTIDENSKEKMNERQRIMFEHENIRLNNIYEKEYNSSFKEMERKNIYKMQYEMNKKHKNMPDIDFEEWYKMNAPLFKPQNFFTELQETNKPREKTSEEQVFLFLNDMLIKRNALRGVNSINYPVFNSESNIFEIFVTGTEGINFEKDKETILTHEFIIRYASSVQIVFKNNNQDTKVELICPVEKINNFEYYFHYFFLTLTLTIFFSILCIS